MVTPGPRARCGGAQSSALPARLIPVPTRLIPVPARLIPESAG
jgi:hypothetical protein